MDFVSVVAVLSGIVALVYAVYADRRSHRELDELSRKIDEVVQENRTAAETMRNAVRFYALIVVATILIIAAFVLARLGGPGPDPQRGTESIPVVDTLVVVDTVVRPSSGQDAVVPGTDTLGTGDPPGHHR